MPIGQPFPAYSRAAQKHSMMFEKKLYPLWKRIRSRVDITKSGKTLWQHLPRYTQSFPPMYAEIKPFLKPEVQREIQPQTQALLTNREGKKC